MKFNLAVYAGWEGRGRDDYHDSIDKEIEAVDLKDAIRQARKIVKETRKEKNWPSDANVTFEISKLLYKSILWGKVAYCRRTNQIYTKMIRENEKFE